MNWKSKAVLQLAFSIAPGGEHLNYLLQRHLTKSLPSSDAEFLASISFAKRHIEALRRHYIGNLASAAFYEFGAGWELTIPLAFYALGVQHQTVVDIRNLLRPELVNHTIERYKALADDPEFVKTPNRHLGRQKGELQALLKESYGIDYRAPCDARMTNLESGSIDCITSTTAMEHIPTHDIRSILRECHRLLRDGGIMSHLIDYLDHYSYFDNGISNYNYLKFSDSAWALFNSGLHYQNRLRHRDHVELCRLAGFEIVEEQCRQATDAEMQGLARIHLAKRFTQYSPQDLAVRYALIVARKKKVVV